MTAEKLCGPATRARRRHVSQHRHRYWLAAGGKSVGLSPSDKPALCDLHVGSSAAIAF